MSARKIGNLFSKDFTLKQRQQMLSLLFSSEAPTFDLCVVGGGITGAAVAREAQLRGLKVALLEAKDFAWGTSSRSSKLVHGGVRYLEQFEFGLVFESVRERARLWKLAPSLVKPLPFLFPAFSHSRVPLWQLNIGLWLYDLLARFQTPTLHRKLGPKKTLEVEPALRSQELTGSIFYWDASTHDSLLTLANITDAWSQGALTLSRTQVRSINWSATPEQTATPHQIEFVDTLTGSVGSLKSRVVCFATGPWSNQLLPQFQVRKSQLLATTRGSHIVVSKSVLPSHHAVVMFHPRDGRVLFSIPWENHTVIGTTDLFDEDSPDKTTITADEVDYLLEASAYYFPNHPVRKQDVLSTWSGLRPLIKAQSLQEASAVSRDHYLKWERPGAVVITGGKLTTHREMAEQTVDLVFTETQTWMNTVGQGWKASVTHHRPLPEFEYGPSSAKCKHRSSAEDLEGVLQTQMVLSLEDLLVRRTDLFYTEKDNGISLLPLLKPLFLKHLKWTESQWEQDLITWQEYIRRNVDVPLGRS